MERELLRSQCESYLLGTLEGEELLWSSSMPCALKDDLFTFAQGHAFHGNSTKGG